MTRITDFTTVGQQQLTPDEFLAIIEQEEAGAIRGPGRNGNGETPRARRLTKADATDPTIVPLFPGEHRPARRW